MMNILLDSHIMLWALIDSDRLPKKARKAIEDEQNGVFYSAVSIWELAIKHALHPIDIPYSPGRIIDLCAATGFSQLVMKGIHAQALETLQREPGSPTHKDPFDRMLIAQAKIEGMRFMTHDSLLPYYGESCIMLV